MMEAAVLAFIAGYVQRLSRSFLYLRTGPEKRLNIQGKW